MLTALTLLVLRCSDLAASKRFYESLGLTFVAEHHGTGPEHWSCTIGSTVLELYPAGQHPVTSTRLGFRVAAATTAGILQDPDGNTIELTVEEKNRSPDVSWSIWRQDDNGHRFRISSGHSRAEAARRCAEFEAHGHKQMYWASPEE